MLVAARWGGCAGKAWMWGLQTAAIQQFGVKYSITTARKAKEKKTRRDEG